ncbi:glycosyltransferase family 2 protein [Arthrobacter sp. 2RAF22]|uniref:glycosyltransferase family 2 protein n=1 Tax=Arthrobacter sp. 2RAF22 TaxID=3232996 RepID=UPI003F938BA8
MTKSSDSLAAVVVHYQSPETLKITLANLGQKIDPELIFIVDNSSSLVKDNFEGLGTILDDGINRGYAGGVNHGFKYISLKRPDVTEVLVCTHEAVFRGDSLEELLKTAAAHPNGHLVGPKLITQDTGREVTWSNGGQLPLPFFYPKHDRSPSRSGVRKVDWVDGATFIMDTRTWAALGGVPEEFFMYMEDVALGLRCSAAGIPVLVNLDAVVEQTANGPSRRLAIRNRILLALRYMSPWKRQVIIAEVRGRQWLMSVHPSKDVRSKAQESREAVREAKHVAMTIAASGRAS